MHNERKHSLGLETFRLPVAICENNVECRIVDCNSLFFKLFGWQSRAEAVGFAFRDAVVFADSNTSLNYVATSKEDGQCIVSPKQSPRQVLQLSVSELELEEGKGTVNSGTGNQGLFIEVIDKTKEKLAEQQLQGIIETSFDGYWDWLIQDDYEYMSPKFWEMFGYDPKEKKHHPSEWFDLIDPDDKASALDLLDKHFKSRGKHPYFLEAKYTHKNGSIVTVLCKGRVVEWGPEGEPITLDDWNAYRYYRLCSYKK